MRTILLFALIGLAGCSKKPQFTEADVAKQIFGDSKQMLAMVSAPSVTAYRLRPKTESDASVGSLVDGYTQGDPVPLSSQQTEAIKHLLRQPASYRLDVLSACIPEYGMLLTFKTEPYDIRVAVCFRCNQFAVFEQDRRLNLEADVMSPMRPQLVSLAKTLFPADPEIESLE